MFLPVDRLSMKLAVATQLLWNKESKHWLKWPSFEAERQSTKIQRSFDRWRREALVSIIKKKRSVHKLTLTNFSV